MPTAAVAVMVTRDVFEIRPLRAFEGRESTAQNRKCANMFLKASKVKYTISLP